MQVNINVATRDIQEATLIGAVTTAVKHLLEVNNITNVTELTFARKWSYAGVRANASGVRRRPDSDLEFWVNIEECSSSVNYALQQLAHGLHYWAIKSKSINKNITRAAFVVSPGLTEENQPMERSATCPKVNPINKDVIVEKHGVKIRGCHEHKLHERNFINKLVAFTQRVLPVDNNHNDIKFNKKSSKSRYTGQQEKVTGFHTSVGQRSRGGPESEINKYSTELTFVGFHDETFARAVMVIMNALKLDKTPVKAFKPAEDDVLFAALQHGVDPTTPTAIVAFSGYAKSILAK